MKRTNAQNQRLHQLLGALGLMDQKPAIVAGYSATGSASSTQLTEGEAALLIAHLETMTAQQAPLRAPADDPANRQRRKVIAMAHEMRWELRGGKADMRRIDTWCREHGYLKKALNDYTLAELPRLVSQFQIMYDKFLADLAIGK